MEHGEQKTGTPDITFDLVSVLYHSLESITSCSKYKQDAIEEDNEELKDFFEWVVTQEREIADRVRLLLRDQLAQRTADEIVDEASEQSFPASDPPAYP